MEEEDEETDSDEDNDHNKAVSDGLTSGLFLPVRRYASAGNSDRNVSVCLSVCHAPVLCQNEES